MEIRKLSILEYYLAFAGHHSVLSNRYAVQTEAGGFLLGARINGAYAGFLCVLDEVESLRIAFALTVPEYRNQNVFTGLVDHVLNSGDKNVRVNISTEHPCYGIIRTALIRLGFVSSEQVTVFSCSSRDRDKWEDFMEKKGKRLCAMLERRGFSAYGFHTLKSLTKSVCNPYDEAHDGITIGECGAFFMLDSLSHALARKAKIYCEITGYALGNDAYHITSPEPNGQEAFMTMRSALEDAQITPSQLDYINGHGTGTVLNDTMETNAMHLLYEDGKMPHVSSTKALVGHCMGASGAMELASVIGYMKPLARWKRQKDAICPKELPWRCCLQNARTGAGARSRRLPGSIWEIIRISTGMKIR